MTSRRGLVEVVLTALLAAYASVPVHAQGTEATSKAEVRAELTRLYTENAKAFERRDLAAVMRLRAPDVHSLTPDGLRHDRAEMERMIEGFMNGVRKWNVQNVTIDSLHVVGDTAYAIVSQHLDRLALRSDNQVHHVETWVTQRETWVRHGASWLMWRVDQLRNQRRLVDGKPG
jgi:ketosteroid isomerase-like protein